MNIFKKKKNEEVELKFEIPIFDPKEDITAFELAQHLMIYKAFIFRGDVEKLNNEINLWWLKLPPAMARHYTKKINTITISKDLIT